MEKLHLNFSGRDNALKSICWLLSIISWLFFLITGWIDACTEKYNLWTFWRYESNFYIPAQMEKPLLMTVFFLTLIIATLGFFAFIAYSTFIQSKVFDGMMGSISRFHFIPLACGGALFLIAETINDSEKPKNLIIAALVFSIIGFISLILVHQKTNMDPWYASLLIKKATFSCLIALFTYSICYTIFQIQLLNELNNFSLAEIINYFIKGKNNLTKTFNNCGIAFSIVIGAVNLCLSFVLKDIMISVMNLLIYIGCTIYYYNVTDLWKTLFDNSGADGIIDIVMIVLSAVTICLLLFMYKADTFKK